jgi:hypothetical protein
MGFKTNKYKMGECTCKNCGVIFEKPLTEIRRNEKLNRDNFCSRYCVGKNNIKNLPKEKQTYDISKHAGNRKDEYTKFKYHFRNIKKRNKNVDVTIEDLKNLWESQEGKCAYLNINLVLSSYSKIKKDPITSASLDRIDSNKGYEKGNLQWISRSMNYMKNNMSDQDVKILLKLIKENGVN